MPAGMAIPQPGGTPKGAPSMMHPGGLLPPKGLNIPQMQQPAGGGGAAHVSPRPQGAPFAYAGAAAPPMHGVATGYGGGSTPPPPMGTWPQMGAPISVVPPPNLAGYGTAAAQPPVATWPMTGMQTPPGSARRSGAGTPDISHYKPDDGDSEIWDLFQRIDKDRSGYVSKLELLGAAQRDPFVAAKLLPGIECTNLMRDEAAFDAADTIFDGIAGGRSRISYNFLFVYLRKQAAEARKSAAAPADSKMAHCRRIFDMIDADKNGSISKLELVDAIRDSEEVNEFILPGVDTSQVMSDEWSFDTVDAIFDTIAGSGKKRITYADFEKYFKTLLAPLPRPTPGAMRSSKRVLIIGVGFGAKINPRQGQLVEDAGFQVHWVHGLPNPETPGFSVQQYIGTLKQELDYFQPHCIAAASKGGIYAITLWQTGLWTGPTVLLNAHPSCRQFPQNMNIVLAHGSNDEVYPTPREQLNDLIATGSKNRCYLYHTANSGALPSGHLSRLGDSHNMESLLGHDCLPRLIDASMSEDGPELHMIRTWRERLGDDRAAAEQWLGYSPENLRRRWISSVYGDNGGQKLFEVPKNGQEFKMVTQAFKSRPKETPAYFLAPQEKWDPVKILKLQRVENPLQDEGSARPYLESLKRALEEQEVTFEPGTHSCWAFHGCAADAIESIVSNPMAGFQPLASGSRGSCLWGLGTYFARDAKYVADGGFCGQPGPDGSRQMLMVLLNIGLPCLGDPNHRGVLPFRQRPHRYNSSVDSLAAPEIFIVQHPGAAIPAYLITFA